MTIRTRPATREYLAGFDAIDWTDGRGAVLETTCAPDCDAVDVGGSEVRADAACRACEEGNDGDSGACPLDTADEGSS